MNLGQECLRILEGKPILRRTAQRASTITDADVAKMAKWYANGMTATAIGKQLGCAESTVRRYLLRLKRGYTQASGESKKNAKLTEDDVRAMRKMKGMPRKLLAERFGVGRSTVQAVLNHETWRHIK